MMAPLQGFVAAALALTPVHALRIAGAHNPQKAVPQERPAVASTAGVPARESLLTTASHSSDAFRHWTQFLFDTKSRELAALSQKTYTFVANPEETENAGVTTGPGVKLNLATPSSGTSLEPRVRLHTLGPVQRAYVTNLEGHVQTVRYDSQLQYWPAFLDAVAVAFGKRRFHRFLHQNQVAKGRNTNENPTVHVKLLTAAGLQIRDFAALEEYNSEEPVTAVFEDASLLSCRGYNPGYIYFHGF